MAVLFVKNNENTYPKGRARIQMLSFKRKEGIVVRNIRRFVISGIRFKRL